MKTIYLAGGCFWGVQAFFDYQKGILKTTVGYAQGDIDNPTYEQVCTGKTNYTETLKIEFDENKISLKEILDLYFSIINPYLLNQQGNDKGTQYRTGIYSEDKTILDYSKNYISDKQNNDPQKIVVENELLKNFFNAEEYHQKYLDKNPNGYCHINLSKYKK
ncbi:peptide methionine sulfoxide reductase [Entomoplasma ellychniae]|uniref:Peptide methionine sulfoxide reductase MsrA n=1 Tax=Entomoplasma ellychniae TaxID=2114 RepID=A0A8E2QW80_9MOLU|nr:peptide-methionine (S)-S-oxide reductase MsrA [Entomoplasma ellychniae]PPE04821.1 peptide methionine sulfoxide reductase [Entomoplasma ellychniae]